MKLPKGLPWTEVIYDPAAIMNETGVTPKQNG